MKTIYYSLSYPLILTRHCGNACGYCNYPLTRRSPLPSNKTFLREIRTALELEAAQLELIAGENLELDAEVQKNLRYYDHSGFIDYVRELLELLRAATARQPLPALLNIGNLCAAALERLRPCLDAVKILIESMDRRVAAGPAHFNAPCKDPEERLNTILNCGRLAIPVATGTMIGIGEDDSSQLKAIEVLAGAHQRYRHVQSFEIQTFWPKPGTPMAAEPEVAPEEIFGVAQMARDILPAEIALIVKAQEHPRLIAGLLEAGVTDLGAISVRCQDQDDPQYWRNLLHRARSACDRLGLELEARQPLRGQFHEPRVHRAAYSGGASFALQSLKKQTA